MKYRTRNTRLLIVLLLIASTSGTPACAAESADSDVSVVHLPSVFET